MRISRVKQKAHPLMLRCGPFYMLRTKRKLALWLAIKVHAYSKKCSFQMHSKSMGAMMGTKEKAPERRLFPSDLAEGAGFEPAVGY